MERGTKRCAQPDAATGSADGPRPQRVSRPTGSGFAWRF